MSLHDLTYHTEWTANGHRLVLQLKAAQAVRAADSFNGFALAAASDLTLSEAGYAFLKHYEGEVRDAAGRHVLYDNDGGGHCTIGHGHLVHRGLCNGRDAAEQTFLNGLNDAEAHALFKQDMVTTIAEVQQNIGAARVTQPMFDAICALHYNVFTRPAWRLYSALGAGDYAGAACEFDIVTSNRELVRGLVNRRIAEIKLYLFGLGPSGETYPAYLACRAGDALPSLNDPV